MLFRKVVMDHPTSLQRSNGSPILHHPTFGLQKDLNLASSRPSAGITRVRFKVSMATKPSSQPGLPQLPVRINS